VPPSCPRAVEPKNGCLVFRTSEDRLSLLSAICDTWLACNLVLQMPA